MCKTFCSNPKSHLTRHSLLRCPDSSRSESNSPHLTHKRETRSVTRAAATPGVPATLGGQRPLSGRTAGAQGFPGTRPSWKRVGRLGEVVVWWWSYFLFNMCRVTRDTLEGKPARGPLERVCSIWHPDSHVVACLIGGHMRAHSMSLFHVQILHLDPPVGVSNGLPHTTYRLPLTTPWRVYTVSVWPCLFSTPRRPTRTLGPPGQIEEARPPDAA